MERIAKLEGGEGANLPSPLKERVFCEYNHRLKISLKQLDKLTGTGCTMLQETILGRPNMAKSIGRDLTFLRFRHARPKSALSRSHLSED